MRVIAGDIKGKPIFVPEGRKIRPTSDKVKGAIFSMLAPEIYDAVVVDMFAGTGSLGIEAISRAAKEVYFIDSSRDSITTIIRNLENCKITAEAKVLHADYRSAIDRIEVKADIILADPPYGKVSQLEILDVASLISKEETSLIIEHGKKEEAITAHVVFEYVKTKTYGQTAISVYKRSVDER